MFFQQTVSIAPFPTTTKPGKIVQGRLGLTDTTHSYSDQQYDRQYCGFHHILRSAYPSCESCSEIRLPTSIIASGFAYLVRGQKKPLSPSFLFLGTTCTCKCGTLWLTRLFIATKVPSASIAVSTARAIN